MRVIAIALTMSVAAACSGGNDLHPASASGGTPPVAPPDTARDAAADEDAGDADAGPIVCMGPGVSATDVIAVTYAASAPMDQGGTIASGTYALTAIAIYLGADGEDPDGGDGGVVDAGIALRARATLVIGNGTLESTRSDDDGAPVTRNAKQHTEGVELVVDETCPGSASQQVPFTVAADTLTLHTTMTRFETYTRRP